MMTRCAAFEYAAHHIRVNCLQPGWHITEMNEATFTPEMFSAAYTALGRIMGEHAMECAQALKRAGLIWKQSGAHSETDETDPHPL